MTVLRAKDIKPSRKLHKVTVVVFGDKSLPLDFWGKITREDSGCWTWTGSNTQGYGRFSLDGNAYATHRLLYETLVGYIPEGLELDHLCFNRSCCNPIHLEPVTQRENSHRGAQRRAAKYKGAKQTHTIRRKRA
jgi:hypothetical protein